MFTTPKNAVEANEQAKRLDRAKALLAEGYTFYRDADSEVIAVCKPGRLAASYFINMLTPGCDCPDFLKTEQACKHMYAYEILQNEEAAAVADELAGLEWQAKIWEDQNMPIFPQLPEAPTLTVGMVLESLQARIIQDLDRAETVTLKRDLQCYAIRYDRQRRLQNLQGALDVIGNYWTKETAGILDLLPAYKVLL